MILKNAHITNYKCIRDSDSFDLDSEVTCLVGKNEAGKTTILEVLNKLKPVRETDAKFDVTKEYFRKTVLEYKPRHDSKPDTAIVTTWQLQEQDYKAIEDKIGPAARKIGEVKVSKRFDDKVFVDFDLNEQEVVQSLLKASTLEGNEKGKYKAVSNVAELASQLAAVPEEQEQRSALLKEIKDRFGDKTARGVAEEAIWNRVPRFAFFHQYVRMPGQLSVQAFSERAESKSLTEQDEVFVSLLDMIGMSVNEFVGLQRYEELIANLEAASGNLTQRLRKYWPDGEFLRMEFKFDDGMPRDEAPFNSGKVFRARIRNDRYDVTVPFDQRSNGFIWFFSFLVWFTQLKKNVSGDLIVMLDEPGLSLHGTAQQELLRFIDEMLAPDYQVIYTSHSLYMLNASRVDRVRPVEEIMKEDDDGIPFGTRVFNSWWHGSRQTILPLADRVSVDLAPALFVGSHRLLVEGDSDLMLIEWFRAKLLTEGRTSLDPRWRVTPCGSISKIETFLNLLAADHFQCAVVCDYADGGKGQVQRLRETGARVSADVLSADQYAEKPEADLEDLLGDDAYAVLVNGCYGLTGDNEFAPPATADRKGTGRIVKAAEEHMRTMPPSIAEFKHTGPPDYLMRQGLDYALPDLESALDRFEALFKDLNDIINATSSEKATESARTDAPRRSKPKAAGRRAN